MKFWNHLLASLVLTMLPAPLLACFCGNSLRFCQALPETGNADHVVFVGKVTQIYPKSWADMMEEFARTHRDLLESLRAQSADTSGRRLAGSPSADLTEWRKQIIEYFWGDTLTPTAREQLRTADQRELERLGFDQHQQQRHNSAEDCQKPACSLPAADPCFLARVSAPLLCRGESRFRICLAHFAALDRRPLLPPNFSGESSEPLLSQTFRIRARLQRFSRSQFRPCAPGLYGYKGSTRAEDFPLHYQERSGI